MSKKISLKDAFVRSVPSQLATEPAEQVAVSTAPQESVEEAMQGQSGGGERAAQVASYAAPPVIQPPVQASIQSTVPLYLQPPPSAKKKATFNLDASLHQRLKVAAAIHSREMVDIVEDALLQYLPGLDHTSKQGLTR